MPAITCRRAACLVATVVIALLVAGCGDQAADSTTATAAATTVEPTTTTKPPATPEEKAWIAGVRKLRQRMDRVFHQSGITLTQAKIGEFIATGRSCRPALARLGSPSDRLAAAVKRASRACRDYERAADAYRRVLPYIAVGSGSPRVEELLNQTTEHEGNGSNGLRDAEAMAKEALL